MLMIIKRLNFLPLQVKRGRSGDPWGQRRLWGDWILVLYFSLVVYYFIYTLNLNLFKPFESLKRINCVKCFYRLDFQHKWWIMILNWMIHLNYDNLLLILDSFNNHPIPCLCHLTCHILDKLYYMHTKRYYNFLVF